MSIKKVRPSTIKEAPGERGVWDEVRRIVAEGKAPLIRVPVAARVVIPKRPRGGSKRRRPEGAGRYALWVMQSAAGNRMKCRRAGCREYLRCQDRSLVCSPECHFALREYCRVTLDVLEGRMPPEDYPSYYRVMVTPAGRNRDPWVNKRGAMTGGGDGAGR